MLNESSDILSIKANCLLNIKSYRQSYINISKKNIQHIDKDLILL